MAEPYVEIGSLLQNAAVGTVGTNIFYGPERANNYSAIPADCVFINVTGGRAPINLMQENKSCLWYYDVQVIVRAGINTYQTGIAKAKTVMKTLNRATVSGYFWCTVQQSYPVYIGLNENMHHRWTVNVILGKEEV